MHLIVTLIVNEFGAQLSHPLKLNPLSMSIIDLNGLRLFIFTIITVDISLNIDY